MRSKWIKILRFSSVALACGYMLSQLLSLPMSITPSFPFLVLSVAITFPYFAALFHLPFTISIDEDLKASFKSTEGFPLLTIREKKGKFNMLALGTRFYPIIIIKGDFSIYSRNQQLALLSHEAGHLRYFDLPIITTFAVTMMKLGPSNDLLWYLSILILCRQLSRFFEYRADQYAAKRTSPEVVISVLKTMDPGNKHLWLESFPILNVLLLTHPATLLRVERVRSLITAKVNITFM